MELFRRTGELLGKLLSRKDNMAAARKALQDYHQLVLPRLNQSYDELQTATPVTRDWALGEYNGFREQAEKLKKQFPSEWLD